MIWLMPHQAAQLQALYRRTIKTLSREANPSTEYWMIASSQATKRQAEQHPSRLIQLLG
jgi:hypothetical protein